MKVGISCRLEKKATIYERKSVTSRPGEHKFLGYSIIPR